MSAALLGNAARTRPRGPSGRERTAGLRLPGLGRAGAVRRGDQRRVGQACRGARCCCCGRLSAATDDCPKGSCSASGRALRPIFAEFTADEHPADEAYLRDIGSERPSPAAQARELWLQTENLWVLLARLHRRPARRPLTGARVPEGEAPVPAKQNRSPDFRTAVFCRTLLPAAGDLRFLSVHQLVEAMAADRFVGVLCAQHHLLLVAA